MSTRLLQKPAAISALAVLLIAGFPVRAETPPSMSPEIQACMKEVLGEERFATMINGVAPTDEEKGKIQTCFTGKPNEEGQKPGNDMTPELRSCLTQAIGEDRFNTISQGQSQPTDEEKQKGKSCFDKLGMRPPKIDTARVIPPGVAECLKIALGEERFNAISSGKAVPTLDDRKAGESCFGATPGQMSEGIKPQMSPKLFECLKAAVGPDRFKAISTGQSTPTDTEKDDGAACFKKFNRTQSTESILPPPTNEVPFLEEKESAVDITGATVTEKNGTDSIALKGKGPKKSVVDVHLIDKNVTVTIQTNWKGTWSYTIKRKLPKGEYDVYATTRYGKKTVRTGVEQVDVK